MDQSVEAMGAICARMVDAWNRGCHGLRLRLLAVRWRDEGWRAVALQNARVVSLERQLALDAIESAPEE
ncbi:hypothetical protein [Streptomyces sp. PT12]|uniref:hypothetical protein n=1 Tax=Streptomyces sp. PT12 TaxID=1510197 RepID=UPI000DE3F71B|nr:hypothetical protein [Streptomyces sp. PT12]RBM23284.1 hypothetical protein DEH69_02880 [Streptomyces sp. PT12]